MVSSARISASLGGGDPKWHAGLGGPMPGTYIPEEHSSSGGSVDPVVLWHSLAEAQNSTIASLQRALDSTLHSYFAHYGAAQFQFNADAREFSPSCEAADFNVVLHDLRTMPSETSVAVPGADYPIDGGTPSFVDGADYPAGSDSGGELDNECSQASEFASVCVDPIGGSCVPNDIAASSSFLVCQSLHSTVVSGSPTSPSDACGVSLSLGGASSSSKLSCLGFLEMVSQARINVPLCVQGDFPKPMILDMPRAHVESDSRTSDLSSMQSLAESLDDFNNPLLGWVRMLFRNSSMGLKVMMFLVAMALHRFPAGLLAVNLIYIQKAILSSLIAHFLWVVPWPNKARLRLWS